MTDADVLALLRGRITYEFRQTEMAKEYSVSRQFLSDVLAGRKRPTEHMLASIGLKRVTKIEYIPIEEADLK